MLVAQLLADECGACILLRYRRSVPVTTMSTLRLPHPEQTSRSRQSSTGVSEERTPSDMVVLIGCNARGATRTVR